MQTGGFYGLMDLGQYLMCSPGFKLLALAQGRVEINRILAECDSAALTERLYSDIRFAIIYNAQWQNYFERAPDNQLYVRLVYFSQLHLLRKALKWRIRTAMVAAAAAAAPDI